MKCNTKAGRYLFVHSLINKSGELQLVLKHLWGKLNTVLLVLQQQETSEMEACEMDVSQESYALDISMTSAPATDRADSSFVPPSCSTSEKSSGSSWSIPEQLTGWAEKKWIVNESKLMELFKKCTTCGDAMFEPHIQINTSGSRIKTWKCNNGHSGKWESCRNVCGMAENNILTAAATLFNGKTYTHISEWASLLNLQIPQKTTYYSIQSCCLIPVIKEAYRKQKNGILAKLIGQTIDGEGVQVCGDGRSDSPGHSCKYTTYFFLDDSTNEIILFDLIKVKTTADSILQLLWKWNMSKM